MEAGGDNQQQQRGMPLLVRYCRRSPMSDLLNTLAWVHERATTLVMQMGLQVRIDLIGD